MIIKLIDKKEGAKGALRYARNLAVYMADADPRRLRADAAGLDYVLTLSAYMTRQPRLREEPRERVLYRGALIGGEQTGWDDGVAEMERGLNARSSRVKKPARHAVLSYRAGEHPTERQCHEAVAMLAEELGCEAAAILWAAHADTDNVHIHALFVTVDPDTGAALPFGQGPDGRANYKEAMQRAIARIEHEQKLQPEPGGRYEVRDGHVVRKPERPAPAQPRKRSPLSQEVLAFEEASGFTSFTRHAQEVAGPILDEATSWVELHRDLGAHGMGIRRKDNGGELHAGDEHVKLSNVDRRHSWSRLIKPDRFGPFVEPNGIDLEPYEPRILDEAKAAAWLKQRDTEHAIAAAIERRVAALIAARDAALAELKSSIAAHRNDLAGFDGEARLRRDIAAAWPRIGADAMAALGAAFDARIAAVRALRHAAAGTDDLDDIDLDGIGAFDSGIAAPWHDGHARPPVAAIQGFDADRRGDVVRYWHAGDPDRRGQPAMVDAGAVIWVNDTADETIAAALQLAMKRYGSAAVFGDRDYLARCAVVADRLGIEISVTTAAEARRRARTANGRHEWRRRSLAKSGAASEAERLRRWARAYVRATLSEIGPEPAASIAASMRDLARHDAIPRMQSLRTGTGVQRAAGKDDGRRPNRTTPSRPSPMRDTGGIA